MQTTTLVEEQNLAYFLGYAGSSPFSFIVNYMIDRTEFVLKITTKMLLFYKAIIKYFLRCNIV